MSPRLKNALTWLLDLVLTFIGLSLLGAIASWGKSPALNSQSFGAIVGIIAIVGALVIFAYQIGRRASRKDKIETGLSYWGIRWRRDPIEEEKHFQFWLMMPIMLLMGIWISWLAFNGGLANPNLITIGALGGMGAFLIGWSAWFMIAEVLNVKEARARRIKALIDRKAGLLNNLSASYEAFSRSHTPEGQRVALGRVGTSLHQLCFGVHSAVATIPQREDDTLPPLAWDKDVRDNLEKYFEAISEFLSDPEAVGICCQHLTWIVAKGDKETTDKMRSMLSAKFDTIYANFNFSTSSGQTLISALVALHQYDISFVNKVIDDSLQGADARFSALLNSLQYDLTAALKNRPDYAKVGAHIVKVVDDFASTNPTVLARAQQLSGVLA